MKIQKRTINDFLFISIVALSVFLGVAGLCHGHSLYIQAARYEVDEGKQSPLFFCYGHHVPVDDGVRAKKLKTVNVHTPSGNIQNIAIRNETGLHSYMVDYDTPGTYCLTAETNPGYYTVYTDKKGRERHTIKPKSAVMEKAAEIKTSLYSKQFTKTYVTCKAPSETFPAVIGLHLELVPAQDPSTIKPGEKITFSVYRNGKPYTGEGTWDATYNGFSTEAEDNFHPKTKSINGTFDVPIPNAGRWFVRYFIKADAAADKRDLYSQEKLTATLVFQVSNPRKTHRKGGR